jgi:trk system potassium uptake protein
LSGEHKKSIAVIGLGRFGEAVAKRLLERGHDVLCIDRDPLIVQQLADDFPHIVQANASEKEPLEAIGVADVDIGVVAIGADLEGIFTAERGGLSQPLQAGDCPKRAISALKRPVTTT